MAYITKKQQEVLNVIKNISLDYDLVDKNRRNALSPKGVFRGKKFYCWECGNSFEDEQRHYYGEKIERRCPCCGTKVTFQYSRKRNDYAVSYIDVFDKILTQTKEEYFVQKSYFLEREVKNNKVKFRKNLVFYKFVNKEGKEFVYTRKTYTAFYSWI